MSFEFRKAIREDVNAIIGLIGSSGSGKTYTAMRLASGIVGEKEKFAVIDTESRRSLHYADMFNFDFLELSPPFKPCSYAEAVKVADDAGYKVIIVDSTSHGWAGEGGTLDQQEEELDRMAGDDYRKREACKIASWIKPKTGHKKMVQKLLQTKATLILCFRAEEKMGMEKDPKTGKVIPVSKGWQPICEKNLPYELTISFLLTSDKPGHPIPIKLQKQHSDIFPLDRPIDEESGKKLFQWSMGGNQSKQKKEGESEPEDKKLDDKEKLDFISTVAGLKKQLNEERYNETLERYGVTDIKKITDRKQQKEIYKSLMSEVVKEYFDIMAEFKKDLGADVYHESLKGIGMENAAGKNATKNAVTRMLAIEVLEGMKENRHEAKEKSPEMAPGECPDSENIETREILR